MVFFKINQISSEFLSATFHRFKFRKRVINVAMFEFRVAFKSWYARKRKAKGGFQELVIKPLSRDERYGVFDKIGTS